MFYIVLIILVIINHYKTNEEVKIIDGGGHYIDLCSNKSKSINLQLFDITNCTETSRNCSNGEYFRCQIICGYQMKSLKIRNILINVTYVMKPHFELRKKIFYYKSLKQIVIHSNSTVLLLLTNQIQILFSTNISCSIIEMINQSIICTLNKIDIQFNEELHVNVSIKYGIGCVLPERIGLIIIKKDSSKNFYLLVAISFICLVIVFLILLTKNKKLKKINDIYFLKQFNERQDKFLSSQRKAIIQYQKGQHSITNMGKLTPRHLRSFHGYLNMISNIAFQRKSFDDPSDKSLYFESMLLNKFQLIEWVSKVESICTIKEREIIASFLTVYLFKFPLYFLDLMKTMLTQLLFDEKKKSNERILFTETQSITELIVTNWLSMCMYENFKTGLEGDRLFNLYRSVKCKINSGLVDNFSKKAKYVLSTNDILTTDLDYDVLKVLVNVDILLKLTHDSQTPLSIIMKNMLVQVLSLDTVSQVKEKIIDQAVMKFVENENCSFPDGENLLTISPIKSEDFHLYLSHHNVKILLSNFDNTSIGPDINKDIIIANTMIHYNIKSECTLLLTSVVQSTYFPDAFSPNNHQTKIHLLISKENDILDIEKCEPKRNCKKLVFKPSIDNENREAHLILLLATKNNLDLFVSDLFQCILNWHPNKEKSKTLKIQGSNLIQINYLFSMFENIATSISLESMEEVQMWKRNILINLFWCKILNNPSLIFTVDLNSSISTTLNVISDVLQLSCSDDASSYLQDPTISIQMFLQDIQSKYSHWWISFIKSKKFAPEKEMELLMQNITEKYQLHQFNGFVLNNLKILGRNLLIK